MNPRLKKALQNEPVPAHLEMRVRASLRAAQAEPERSAWHWPIAAATAMAVLAVGFFALHRQENSYIATLSKSLTSTMQVGFGDHLHCTILRKQPERPKPLEAMKKELGPEYAALIPAVATHVPRNYQVLDAHKCHFQKREFVHLVMNLGDRFVSVLVANQKPGEVFSPRTLVPALAQTGIPFYQQGTGGYQIAGFESGQHLIYVISDLPQEQNQRLMAAMAPDLKRALPAL